MGDVILTMARAASLDLHGDDGARNLEMAGMLSAMRAALAAAEQAGWVLVPKEPTEKMIAAGTGQQYSGNVWREMLYAAPQQQRTEK